MRGFIRLLVAVAVAFAVLVCMEGARLLWAGYVLDGAASVGARLASQGAGSDAEVAAEIERTLADRGIKGDYSVTIDGDRDRPTRVRVAARVASLVLPVLQPRVAATRMCP